jgi:ABC-2 type transport system permease protein
MLVLIRTELMKLRRSLALSLCLAAPACVAAFAALALATSRSDKTWDRFLDEGLAMWSFFMLPMTVTALTILLAQLEHGARAWNHLLVLPVARRRLFTAKVLVTLGLLLLLQLLVYAGLYSAGFLVQALFTGNELTGDLQLRGMAVGLTAMAVGAVPMLLLQLWAALSFRSFVPPLVIGILGTFAALVITASSSNVYLPWLLPVYATMWPKAAGLWGTWLGVGGGLVTLAAMLVYFERREAL